MAEAPKPQRRSRRNGSAAPTADDTPSGVNPSRSTRRRGRQPGRRRNPRVAILTDGVNVGPRRMPRRVLTRRIKAEIKREGLEGPKVAVQQRITSTFGMIGPNTTGNTELELNFFTHPSLAKEANDGTAFGPLQALAAQYALWKIKYLTLKFTPMVGASAVSGTVVRASLNLSQSPGGNNWSGLGTRVHLDMHPGQSATFHLRGDQIGGPRDGGWWFTDTNEEGSQSAGPIVEIHTLGKTLNAYRDQPWDGPLFLVEGIGLWQFANYQVKPALGSLERREADVEVAVTSDAGGPIQMDLPINSDLAVFMDSVEPESLYLSTDRAAQKGSQVGETIFQIVDIGAKLATQAAPPPFSWLIKGGWWFVKRLLGRARANQSSFLVYASLADAQNNKPAIATSSVNVTRANSRFLVTQINAPNVGPNQAVASARMGPQTLQPGDPFRVSSDMISELIVQMPDSSSPALLSGIPVSAIPGLERDVSGNPLPNPTASGVQPMAWIQTPWWIGAVGRAPVASNITAAPSANMGGYVHSLYRLINPKFTDRSGFYEYYPPTNTDTDVNFCVLNTFNGSASSSAQIGVPSADNPYAVYGKVVATNVISGGTQPPLSMVFTLIKTITDYQLDRDTVPTMLMVMGNNVGSATFIEVPYNKTGQKYWNITERTIPAGQYLLAVSYTNNPVTISGVDIPTTLQKITYQRVEGTTAPIFPYNLAGQLFPATSVDLVLANVDYHPPTQLMVDQLRALNLEPRVPSGLLFPSYPAIPEAEEPILEISDAESVPEDEDPGCGEDGGATDSDADSVEEFWRSLGDEMIAFPKRWSNDPRICELLDISSSP